jgi:HxlR-like helix-turn-helix
MRQPILVLNAGQHLKEMESDGIVKRRDFHEVPPHVEYALTSFGQSLRMALAPPCESGTHHMKRIETRKESAEAKIRQQALSAALGPSDRRRLSATARDFHRDSQPDLVLRFRRVPGSASDFARQM